ncbi:MAG: DUF4194 domain-containing protein [Actinomycetota bacterium]|jgi:hypothetical protein|nr:DUF4194 domain-containing protein [Actinomycetota bacterium]
MSDLAAPAPTEVAELSLVVVNLCRGPLYRDTSGRAWEALERLRAQVIDYVGVLGLQLVVDEAEGYAFLRSQPRDDGPNALPRLVARRPLSFPVSVLLALLRKRLAESDATSGETRLVLKREQIAEMLRLFLAESANEARLVDQVDAHINKVVELGFLQRLRATPDAFEVRRILKAYVDGQWLADFDRRLAEYLGEIDDDGNEVATTVYEDGPASATEEM